MLCVLMQETPLATPGVMQACAFELALAKETLNAQLTGMRREDPTTLAPLSACKPKLQRPALAVCLDVCPLVRLFVVYLGL